MKSSEIKIPPLWVKVFSFIFLIFLVTPIFAVRQIAQPESQLGISAFGLDLEGSEDPLLWMTGLYLVLFLGALTGLFILLESPFAYGFGIFYCAVAVGVTFPGHFVVGHWDNEAWWNIAIQYPLLAAFLVHLLRNRALWITRTANKTRHSSPDRTEPKCLS